MHGGVAPTSPAVAVVPPRLDEHPVGVCLGSGGFAAVWEIAGGVLKVAHADHELARARMAREAEALAAIGAPHVPRITGAGVLADGRAWIAMERIAGTSLADIAMPVALDRALSIALGTLDALAGIHAARFVHRDLKPDNIYRRPDGAIVILDLGLARKLPADPGDPTRAGVQVGSLEYMPPEQLLDAASVDERADLYAFGCVLYELVAGRPPFVGDTAALERAHAALRPPPLGALATIPAELEAICDECLAKLPDRRPSSARALRDRVAAVGQRPAPDRAQRTLSIVREGKQPVVLLWAELPKVDRALLAALAARKLAIVSQRGRRVLAAAVGAEHADPAGAALAAARDLAAAGARVALHLDLVHTTPKLAGLAIEKPEEWLPSGPWSGVVLTRAVAAVSQVPTKRSELGAGFVLLGDPGETTELFGRDALLADLSADAAVALGGGGPALAVIVGEHGAGKTALAGALVPRLRELGARVVLGTVPPPGGGRPGHSALAELVGTIASGASVVRTVGDAVRGAAREQPVAVLVDDIHLADHELLDALEYATLGGEPLRLWVLALGTPRIEQRRPGFGARAERHRRDVLPPLDDDAALAMTAALLRPAEYPPLRALRQIAAIARGNPLHLASLVREIHDRGAIRTRPNGEHFLDTTALDSLPPIALGPWLAARELAPLGGELVALARICAVLGDVLDRDEIATVVALVERRGGATTTIDVDVGFAELVTAGILVTRGERRAFREALVQEGIYATTNEAERLAIHQAALELWQRRDARDPDVAERIARHAEVVGERGVAAAAFATLGEHAHREHRPLDADQAWQGAVRNLDARDRSRARALIGRARARYRLQRVRDALADLDEALAIARELGDAELEIAALLEQATAHDWGDDFAASAVAAQHAADLHAAAARPALAPQVALAMARIVYRQGRFADSVPLLDRVLELARAAHHQETETIALVLRAPALVESGQLERAEQAFAELLEHCAHTGDRFHLGAAYANRTWLWAARGEVERVDEDLRRVIQLARESGQAALERIATYNLAEDRLWQGALGEAANLARRGLSLQRGHGEGATWVDELLLARVLAAQGDAEEARPLLERVAAVDVGNENRALIGVLRCFVERADLARWEHALRDADQIANENVRLELAVIAKRHAALSPDRLDGVRALVSKYPVWIRRHEF